MVIGQSNVGSSSSEVFSSRVSLGLCQIENGQGGSDEGNVAEVIPVMGTSVRGRDAMFKQEVKTRSKGRLALPTTKDLRSSTRAPLRPSEDSSPIGLGACHESTS